MDTSHRYCSYMQEMPFEGTTTEIIGSCGADTGWLGFLLNFELYGSIPFKP